MKFDANFIESTEKRPHAKTPSRQENHVDEETLCGLSDLEISGFLQCNLYSKPAQGELPPPAFGLGFAPRGSSQGVGVNADFNRPYSWSRRPYNYPMPDIAAEKRQLRRSCRQIRQELGEAARQEASLAICAWIESWPIFQRSSLILTYMPIPGEVDLTPLLPRQPQKCWLLPRILPEDNHRMVFHPYESGRLIRHPFGMAEPAPDLPVIPSSEVQLALVPGLAFDRLGRRLGYGGGYFDRFLRDFSGVSLGVTFQALLLDQLPCGEHDVAVQWIVTERGIISSWRPGVFA